MKQLDSTWWPALCLVGAMVGAAAPTCGQEATTTAAKRSATGRSIAAEQQPVEPDRAGTAAQQSAREEPPKTQTLLVDNDRLRLVVPASWKLEKPRSNIIDVELSILPREDASRTAESQDTRPDKLPPLRGRLTMMAAGGDVDANIRRWVGQFRLGRDADGKDAMHRDRRRLRGAVAHVLDIAGTYFDTPDGPFGPKVELSDYRMLGAIIEIEGAGKYFVKFYGPAAIVEENREAFEEMLSSLELVEPPAEPPSPHRESSEPEDTREAAS